MADPLKSVWKSARNRWAAVRHGSPEMAGRTLSRVLQSGQNGQGDPLRPGALERRSRWCCARVAHASTTMPPNKSMRPMTWPQNWLFAGSNSGKARVAAIYTSSPARNWAKLARSLEDYLRKVLARIADHPAKRMPRLLPWNLEGVRRPFWIMTPPERRASRAARQTYRVDDRTLAFVVGLKVL